MGAQRNFQTLIGLQRYFVSAIQSAGDLNGRILKNGTFNLYKL